MAIHDVDVEGVGASLFDDADLLAELREIGGEDGGQDFDARVGHEITGILTHGCAGAWLRTQSNGCRVIAPR